jgi:two-component system, OmpR family, sensor histidine kinase KdpD
VVLVDLTPRALRNRLERGVVYSQEKAHQAMENFFTEANLAALREMALRHTAHEVEEKLRPAEEEPAAGLSRSSQKERILICLTGNPSSAILLRRGKRVADYLQADCLAIHVATGPDGRKAVERHISFARNLRIETTILEAADVPDAIAEFARAQRVTQIFMGRSHPPPWWRWFEETIVQRVVRRARDMQITIVAERRR